MYFWMKILYLQHQVTSFVIFDGVKFTFNTKYLLLDHVILIFYFKYVK